MGSTQQLTLVRIPLFTTRLCWRWQTKNLGNCRHARSDRHRLSMEPVPSSQGDLLRRRVLLLHSRTRHGTTSLARLACTQDNSSGPPQRTATQTKRHRHGWQQRETRRHASKRGARAHVRGARMSMRSRHLINAIERVDILRNGI